MTKRKHFTVVYSSWFERALKRIPKEIQQALLEKEPIFLNNPFDPKLGTHKLHGKYKSYWAFTVTGSYRIMFCFLKNKKTTGFINIGTHDIYK